LGYNKLMKRLILGLLIIGFSWWGFSGGVKAEVLPEPELASQSAEASRSASSSGIVEKVVKKKSDITENRGAVKNKLEKVLEENPIGELRWNNFLRYAIFQAVKNGVPVNTIVLVLLFPLVAAAVAAARHLIGVRGLGIFTPSLLAIGFLATGIGVGVILFAIILLVATLARIFLRRLKLQYLPRMALLLWFVSLGVFGALLGASYINYSGLITVGIFPILILMLLAESFIDIQAGRSWREAWSLMITTFVLAIAISFVIGLDLVQRMVLLHSELVFFGVAVFDYFMAKYVGLRLLEYIKFRPIIKGEEEE